MNLISRAFSGLLIGGGLLLASLLPAAARIGESEAACLARYGEIIARTPAHLPGAESITCVKLGIRVRVEFLNGQAVFISFSKPGLNESDREALLAANSGDQEWNGPESLAGRTFWRLPASPDGGDRVAMFHLTGNIGTLEIATRPWLDGIVARRRETTAVALAALAVPRVEPAAAASEAPEPAKEPAPAERAHLEGF